MDIDDYMEICELHTSIEPPDSNGFEIFKAPSYDYYSRSAQDRKNIQERSSLQY